MRGGTDILDLSRNTTRLKRNGRMKWQGLIVLGVTLLLIQSCSTQPVSQDLSSLSLAKNTEANLVLIAPEIPFSREDAFYPLRRNKEGRITPSYQWRKCTKKFIWCTQWTPYTLDLESSLEWFYANGFGLTKRKKPSL